MHSTLVRTVQAATTGEQITVVHAQLGSLERIVSKTSDHAMHLTHARMELTAPIREQTTVAHAQLDTPERIVN